VKRAANLEVYRKLSADAETEGHHPAVLAFWKYLFLCFETPRPSTDYVEPDTFSRLDKIRQALSAAATALGAEVTEDPAGNLIVRREGRGAGAQKPWLCLQGHLDMVVSQNEGVGHDFELDPIDVRFSSDDGLTDGWLKPVKATTLGADNGVALAASLALLETLDSHPPLELLFTSNEETNFYGAENLAPGTLKSKRLLNLDSEDEYTIVLGSAGIFEHQYKLQVERSADRPKHLVPVSVKLAGLHGGHSGVDIHKEYGNANKLLARLMLMACASHDEVLLLELSGGSGPTAIPREASCVVLVSAESATTFCDFLSASFAKVQDELKSVESTMELRLAVCSASSPEVAETAVTADVAVAEPQTSAPAEAAVAVPPPVDVPMPPLGRSNQRPLAKRKGLLMTSWQCSRCEKCVAKAIESGGDIGVAESTAAKIRRHDLGPLTVESSRKVWQFCCNMPNGVLRMSTDVPGLVESSVNFGVVTLSGEELFCHLCVRSSVTSFLDSYSKTLSAFGALAGAKNIENICPGSPWQPRLDSALLSVLKRTHAEQFGGKEPHVTAIHAGLEPGVLMDSHPGLDCCSIGPSIKNPHSPDERVNIASAQRFVLWLRRTVETLAGEV